MVKREGGEGVRSQVLSQVPKRILFYPGVANTISKWTAALLLVITVCIASRQSAHKLLSRQ
jgi:hypothetical protein